MSVRRCPKCETVNRPTAPVCDCGFVFDEQAAQVLALGKRAELDHETLEQQRHFHTHRLTLGWFAIVGFVLLLVTSGVLVFSGSPILMFPAAAGSFVMFMKGAQMVSTARRELRAIGNTEKRLPRARLLKR